MSDAPWTSWITELRRRLSSPPAKRLPHDDSRQAAVLVPLYVDARELWTILTKRSEDLPTHKGQIAFPGGGLEPGEGLWDGALREAREEVGIDPDKVLRLGELDETATGSGYRIVPCVGAVAYPIETRVNPSEIEEIFPVPITAFSNPQLVEDRAVKLDGKETTLRVYHIGGRQVWGLTARIIQNLLVRLGLEPDGLPN